MNRSLVALSLFALALPAAAGVRMEFTDTQPGQAAPSLSKAFVSSESLRIESDGQVVIFRGDKQVLWAIDAPNASYIELTKGDMNGISEAMKQMEKEMAGMSPEERAMMQKMMSGAMPGGPAAAPRAPLAWTANGSADTIGGHACKGYDGARDGKVEEKICAAEWTAFGLTEADFAAFTSFGKFLEQMTGPMAGMAKQMQGSVIDGSMPGVPLRTVVKTPQGDAIHEVTLLEKADVAGSLFGLPPGLKKQDMGGMGEPPQGRRGR